MLELLTDRRDFRAAVLIVASGFGVWSLATSTGWGRIPATFVLMVLIAELVTKRLPDPLLLVLTVIPTALIEAQGKGNVGWFVVVTVLTIVASSADIRPVTRVLIVGTIAAPVVLWAARVEDYVELGPWTWLAGLTLGWAFGAVIGHLTKAIGELEESRALLAESTAREERQRIARELHDLVGHSFSVVLLHLSGARTTLATDPDRAAAALADAEAVGRQGMDDLREALALVRDDEGRRRPVEGLSGLDHLVEGYRRAGLEVALHRDGPLDGVATAVGIVAYEVVREALTNAAKHAPDADVEVRLDATAGVLAVTVVNDSVASTLDESGSGVDGMRHRVHSLGGTFDAGPSDGRWLVSARLPTGATSGSGSFEVRA